MQKITPCLWFEDQAEEAAHFYASVFNNAQIGQAMRYGEDGPRPAGTVLTIDFTLDGQEFTALNGGPEFNFTPAISFFVNCDSESEVVSLWEKLSEGGRPLMPLDAYPFSKKFGWVADKYGLTWQLNLGSGQQKIVPALMFTGAQHGRAAAAMNSYTALFNDSQIEAIEPYGEDEGEMAGTVKVARFTLAGQEFMAMDSGLEHEFTFTEALSLYVRCEDQAEVDRLWSQLSYHKDDEQCGWLKDRNGVSWQIVPAVLDELMAGDDPERSQRVMEALLQMKKLDIQGLQRAYAGEN